MCMVVAGVCLCGGGGFNLFVALYANAAMLSCVGSACTGMKKKGVFHFKLVTAWHPAFMGIHGDFV